MREKPQKFLPNICDSNQTRISHVCHWMRVDYSESGFFVDHSGGAVAAG